MAVGRGKPAPLYDCEELYLGTVFVQRLGREVRAPLNMLIRMHTHCWRIDNLTRRQSTDGVSWWSVKFLSRAAAVEAMKRLRTLYPSAVDCRERIRRERGGRDPMDRDAEREARQNASERSAAARADYFKTQKGD
jgi:hypothetical protein